MYTFITLTVNDHLTIILFCLLGYTNKRKFGNELDTHYKLTNSRTKKNVLNITQFGVKTPKCYTKSPRIFLFLSFFMFELFRSAFRWKKNLFCSSFGKTDNETYILVFPLLSGYNIHLYSSSAFDCFLFCVTVLQYRSSSTFFYFVIFFRPIFFYFYFSIFFSFFFMNSFQYSSNDSNIIFLFKKKKKSLSFDRMPNLSLVCPKNY